MPLCAATTSGLYFFMSDPAFLFYSKDFLTGVAGLTMEERGQYITLLCLQHQNGHLSEKAIKLAIGNPLPDVLAKFKKDEAGLFFNERLENEAIKRKKYAESRRKNIEKRYKKAENDPTYVATYEDTYVLHMVNGNANANGSVNGKENTGAKTEKLGSSAARMKAISEW